MERRVDALDGLRGIAAFTVLLNHILLLWPSMALASYRGTSYGPLQWLLQWTPLHAIWSGTEAVWLFFILSGYVLTRRQLAGEPLATGSYYWRRACRLYIPFWASLVFALALRGVPHRIVSGGSWWMNAHAAHSGGRSVLEASTLLLGNPTHLNSVYWSLRWEVWFSLALPLVVLLARPLRRHLWVLGVACLFVSAAGPALWGNRFGHPDLFTQAIAFLPMFGVGVALAAYEPQIRTLKVFRSAGGGVGWAAVAVCTVAYVAHFPIGKKTTWVVAHGHISSSMYLTRQELGIALNVLTLCAAGGFIVLALAFHPLERALSAGPLLWLGVRSYSLYVVHEPIVVTLGFALGLTGMPIWFVVLATALSLAVTSIFYRLVEAPAIKVGRRSFRQQPAVA